MRAAGTSDETTTTSKTSRRRRFFDWYTGSVDNESDRALNVAKRTTILLGAALALGALVVGATNMFRVEANEIATAPTDPTTEIERYLADGYWDASGQRAGIATTDIKSPWMDFAAFNELRSHPYDDVPPDYRRFVTASVVASDTSWADRVAVEPGDTLRVQIVAANHADPELLANSPDERGIVVGAKAIVGYADQSSRRFYIYGAVGGTNTTPAWVAASVIIESELPVRLEPVPDSALIRGYNFEARPPLRNLVTTSGPDLVDRTIRSGLTVGSRALDGRVELNDGFTVFVDFRVVAG